MQYEELAIELLGLLTFTPMPEREISVLRKMIVQEPLTQQDCYRLLYMLDTNPVGGYDTLFIQDVEQFIFEKYGFEIRYGDATQKNRSEESKEG